MARVAGARNRFKLGELKRAVRGVRAAGLPVARVEIDREGKIAVVAGEPAKASEAGQKAGPEPSEAELDDELADWEEKKRR